MTKAIVYSSVTNNTKLLADTILEKLGSEVYCGKPNDEAINSDFIFVGFWTMAFSCPPDIKDFLGKLKNKKILLFCTAGYNNSPEFFENILNSVKENIDSSNEIVGSFMCQGKVSEAKQEGIKKMDMAKYESMKEMLDISVSHPDTNDITNFTKAIEAFI